MKKLPVAVIGGILFILFLQQSGARANTPVALVKERRNFRVH